MYKFWLLQGGIWVEQDGIKARNRKSAAIAAREKGYKEGTWKLRKNVDE